VRWSGGQRHLASGLLEDARFPIEVSNFERSKRHVSPMVFSNVNLDAFIAKLPVVRALLGITSFSF
jgi:hypothetical protein